MDGEVDLKTAVEQWVALKLSRHTETISESKSVEVEFTKIYGPRRDFAWLRLKAEPSNQFDFQSQVDWPSQPEVYDAAVLEGILDELFTMSLSRVVLNVRFILQEIDWHDIYSSPNAFYRAARQATRKILGRD